MAATKKRKKMYVLSIGVEREAMSQLWRRVRWVEETVEAC